jgi:hypothetical protein
MKYKGIGLMRLFLDEEENIAFIQAIYGLNGIKEIFDGKLELGIINGKQYTPKIFSNNELTKAYGGKFYLNGQLFEETEKDIYFNFAYRLKQRMKKI